MTLFAKNIMVKDFDSIHMNAPIEDAIQAILNGKLRKTGHKTKAKEPLPADSRAGKR